MYFYLVIELTDLFLLQVQTFTTLYVVTVEYLKQLHSTQCRVSEYTSHVL